MHDRTRTSGLLFRRQSSKSVAHGDRVSFGSGCSPASKPVESYLQDCLTPMRTHGVRWRPVDPIVATTGSAMERNPMLRCLHSPGLASIKAAANVGSRVQRTAVTHMISLLRF